ncbi:selenocysteine-specific translation elongation factor, partial [bacterium]|nr:selenocysteine-specific translation elongation factor [bacterium]
MVDYYILGTAGHIDHGKTELTKALTNIDTDRLLEEKKRGISIELGFAYIDLDGDNRVGVVDVPGHERFIKNMLAGATGIDVVLFVIAADEGIMPQSIEHLNICNLLSIKSGIVVLTKIDLVEEDWIPLVMSDIKEFTKGTFLENAPIIKTSAKTREGIEDLKIAIKDILKKIQRIPNTSMFRFPIDRVFTIRGFGTVVTGTVISGSVKKDKEVELLPEKRKVRIRGLQVHNMDAGEIQTGQRGAINLASIEKIDIKRGDMLAEISKLKPSSKISSLLKMVRDTDFILKNRSRVRFHIGTSEIIARISVLGSESLYAGEERAVLIHLEKPICCLRGDRFIIRSYSPSHTIGGGVVVDPSSQKIKRTDKRIHEKIKIYIEGNISDIAEYQVKEKGIGFTGHDDLQNLCNFDETKTKEVEKSLEKSPSIHTLKGKDANYYISKESLSSVLEEIIDLIRKFHKVNPLKPGYPKEELKSKFLLKYNLTDMETLFQYISNQNKLIMTNRYLSLPDFELKLSFDDEATILKIEKLFLENPAKPPDYKQLLEDPHINKKVLEYMINNGIITKVTSGIIFYTKTLDKIEK